MSTTMNISANSSSRNFESGLGGLLGRDSTTLTYLDLFRPATSGVPFKCRDISIAAAEGTTKLAKKEHLAILGPLFLNSSVYNSEEADSPTIRLLASGD